MAAIRTVWLFSAIGLAWQAAAFGSELDSPVIDVAAAISPEQQVAVAIISSTDHLAVGMSCRVDTEVTAPDGMRVQGSYWGTVKRADAEGVALSVTYFREQREKKSRFEKVPYLDGAAKPVASRGSLDNKEMWFPTSAVKQLAWCGLLALNDARAAAQQDVAIVATKLTPERLRQSIDEARLNALAPTDWHSVNGAPLGVMCRVEASEKTGPDTTYTVYEGTVKTADKNGVLLVTTRRKEWKDQTRTFIQQLPVVDLFYLPKPVEVPWQDMGNQCIWIPTSNIHDVLIPRGKQLIKPKTVAAKPAAAKTVAAKTVSTKTIAEPH